MPKVSIIIPTFNRAVYLKLAVESILEQSFKDFELIITDNASTDNTEEMINTFDDKRIRYYRNEENVGIVKNHNLALTKCSGEYIHIFSDDDLMLNECIEKKVLILDAYKNVGVVHSNITGINSDGNVLQEQHWATSDPRNSDCFGKSRLFKNTEISKILYFDWNIISMPSVMMRSSVLSEVGYLNPNTYYFCDWDYWLRISSKYDFYYLTNKLISYRTHAKNNIHELTNAISLIELVQMKINYYSKDPTKRELRSIRKVSLNQLKTYKKKEHSFYRKLKKRVINKLIRILNKI